LADQPLISEIYILFIFPAASTPHRNYTPPGISLPSEMEADMLDAIFLAAGLAFFAIAIGYTLICERL
jgi:hypothetical protein